MGHFHSSGRWNPNVMVSIHRVWWAPPLWLVWLCCVPTYCIWKSSRKDWETEGRLEPPSSYLCFLWVHLLSSSWLCQWLSSNHAYSCLDCSQVCLYPLQTYDLHLSQQYLSSSPSFLAEIALTCLDWVICFAITFFTFTFVLSFLHSTHHLTYHVNAFTLQCHLLLSSVIM